MKVFLEGPEFTGSELLEHTAGNKIHRGGKCRKENIHP